MGRSTTKHCKQCGQTIDNGKYLSYCTKCLSNNNKQNIKKYYNENENWRHKQKWRHKIKQIETDVPTKPRWNHGFNPSVTINECTTCKEIHYEDQIYYHEYTKKGLILGIDLIDLEELIEEVITDVEKNNETIKSALEKRGLEINLLIKEELEGEEKE